MPSLGQIQSAMISYYHILIGITCAVFGASIIWRRAKDQINDSVGSATTFILESAVKAVLPDVIGLYFILSFFSEYSFFKIPTNLSTMLLTVLIADFVYYWKHRCQHKWAILWTEHSVHHSTKYFNYLISFRACFYSFVLTWPFFLPEILLGFSPLQVIVGYRVVTLYQWTIHTEHCGKLRFLDAFLNTPSNHRPHHGTNPQYVDKNFGGILIIWDRLFGTYEPEGEKVNFGSIHTPYSVNPLEINFKAWKYIWLSIKARSGFFEKMAVFFKPIEVGNPTPLGQQDRKAA